MRSSSPRPISIEDGLKRWGKEHDVARLVTEPAVLFADPNIDIIDICTPNNYHAPLVIAAMEAGKHVICEKPLVDHHPVFAAGSKQSVPRNIFDVEEMAAACVRFDNGATLVIESQLVAAPRAPRRKYADVVVRHEGRKPLAEG